MGKGKLIKRKVSVHKDKTSNLISREKKELFEVLRTHVNLRDNFKVILIQLN